MFLTEAYARGKNQLKNTHDRINLNSHILIEMHDSFNVTMPLYIFYCNPPLGDEADRSSSKSLIGNNRGHEILYYDPRRKKKFY